MDQGACDDPTPLTPLGTPSSPPPPYDDTWQVEKELEAALHQYVIATGDEEEDAAFIAVEAGMLHAELLRKTLGDKCTTFQADIYAHARKIVDANAAARLTPLAEEALWLLDREKMQYCKDEAARVAFTVLADTSSAIFAAAAFANVSSSYFAVSSKTCGSSSAAGSTPV